MQPTSIGSAAQNRSIGPDAPLPFLVVAYPQVAVGLLIGGVAVAALSLSLAAHVRRHRGTVRRVTLPGFGTVEYRFTRA